MKWVLFAITVFAFFTYSCSSQRNLDGALNSNNSHAAFNRTPATYYQIDSVLTNADFSNLLVGSWEIESIKWERRNRSRHLIGTTLILQPDNRFICITSCDTIKGQFTINRNRINFSNMGLANGYCVQTGLTAYLMNMLHIDASFYQVDNSSLLLKDGNGTGLLLASRMPLR